MQVGVLDLLKILPLDEVEPIGIPYVRSVLEKDVDTEQLEKWDKFWKYFYRQWIPIIGSWNIVNADNSYKSFVNRTNNGMERYNQRFNNLFSAGSRTPALDEFVTTCEEESHQQYKDLEDIQMGRIKRPVYMGKSIPTIPAQYFA